MQHEKIRIMMTFSFSKKIDQTTPCVFAFLEGETKVVLPCPQEKFLKLFLKKEVFRAESGEHLETHDTSSGSIQKIMLFGLGKKKDLNNFSARNLGAKIIKAAREWKEKKIALVLPKDLQGLSKSLAEGLVMGGYNAVKYKTGEEKKKLDKKMIEEVIVLGASWSKQKKACEESLLIGESVNEVRDMVNAGPNILGTKKFVEMSKEVAREGGYRFHDLGRKEMKKLGLNGILAVNRGSEEEGHLLILEHRTASTEAPILLVGKGIIFDTGGINLKPSGSLHEMHLDMAGAAAVLGVFQLLKKMGIQKNVIGLMPVTDNAIGSKAYKPADIISTYSGKTVEVMNTDAEGRMILCDALAYGIEKYKPRAVIDIATLTGACMVALAFRTAALLGNDEKLMETIKAAAKVTDEPVCEFPITDADENAIKGKMADISNSPANHPYGGISRAAAFLRHFVGKTPWAHLDIAGCAYTKDPKDYEALMGTGFGVRLLIEVLKQL